MTSPMDTIGGQAAQQVVQQQQYQLNLGSVKTSGANNGYVVAPSGNSSAGQAKTLQLKSHRVTNKLRQSNTTTSQLTQQQQAFVAPKGESRSSFVQQSKQQKQVQLQSQQQIELANNNSGRRNQSPLATLQQPQTQQIIQETASMVAVPSGSVSGVLKQKKTRNNLQQHVVSQNPQARQVIVGQPYISFKNQPAKSNRNFESVDQRMLQSQNQPVTLKQKTRYQNHQQHASKQTHHKQAGFQQIQSQPGTFGAEVATDVQTTKSISHNQHRQLKNISKNSFRSQESTQQIDMESQKATTFKCPQLFNKDGSVVSSGGGGGNCVISVPGLATLTVAAGSNLTTQSQSLQSSALQTQTNRNVNLRHRKHQKSQLSLVSGLQASYNTGKSPYQQQSQQRAQLQSNSSVVAYDDLPIAISDQATKMPQIAAQFKEIRPAQLSSSIVMPSSQLNQKSYKKRNTDHYQRHSLGGPDLQQSHHHGTLGKNTTARLTQFQKQKAGGIFSQQKYSEATPIGMYPQNPSGDLAPQEMMLSLNVDKQPSMQQARLGGSGEAMTVQDDSDNQNLVTEGSSRMRVGYPQNIQPSGSGKRTINGSSLPACNRRLSNEDGGGDGTAKSSYATQIEVSNLSAYQSHAFVSRQKAAFKTLKNKDNSMRSGGYTGDVLLTDKTISQLSVNEGYQLQQEHMQQQPHNYSSQTRKMVSGSSTSQTPYGKSQLSLHGAAMVSGAGSVQQQSNNANKEQRQNALKKQFMSNQQQNTGAIGQIKKFVGGQAKEEHGHSISNNRYKNRNRKDQVDQIAVQKSSPGLEKADKEHYQLQHEGQLDTLMSTSRRRNISQLSKANSKASTNNSKSLTSKHQASVWNAQTSKGQKKQQSIERYPTQDQDMVKHLETEQALSGSKNLQQELNDANELMTNSNGPGMQSSMSKKHLQTEVNNSIIRKNDNLDSQDLQTVSSRDTRQRGVQFEEAANFDNSVGSIRNTSTTNKVEVAQADELLTPKSKSKIITDVAAKKTESIATQAQMLQAAQRRTQKQQKSMASAYDLLPYMRSGKASNKERKYRSNQAAAHMVNTVSQSPTMKSHHTNTGGIYTKQSQDTQQNSAKHDKGSRPLEDSQTTSRRQGRASIISIHSKKQSFTEATAEQNKKGSSSRAARGSNKKRRREGGQQHHQTLRQSQSKHANDSKRDTSMNMSNSVTSLPRIVCEEKTSNAYAMAVQKRLGSHRPSQKINSQSLRTTVNINKNNIVASPQGSITTSVGGAGGATRTSTLNHQLSQRFPGGSNQPQKQISMGMKNSVVLTPRGNNTNITLKKSTQSFSVLRKQANTENSNNGTSGNQNAVQLPKLKKQVSIRGADAGSAFEGTGASALGQINASPKFAEEEVKEGMLQHASSKVKIRPKGTPMHRVADSQQEDHQDDKTFADQVNFSNRRRAGRHTKSNSLFTKAAGVSSTTQNTMNTEPSIVTDETPFNSRFRDSNQKQNTSIEQNDAQTSIKNFRNNANARSMSTSFRISNQSRRNSGNIQVISGQRTVDQLTFATDMGDQLVEDSGLISGGGGSQHEIRIEISKTEVLDSMKKEHMKDLSLLYYDFNNSKARLMSKMKKITEFVIHEEADGAEGDNQQAAAATSTVNFTDQKQIKHSPPVQRGFASSSPLHKLNKKLPKMHIEGPVHSMVDYVEGGDSPLSLRKSKDPKNLTLKATSIGQAEASSKTIKQLDLPTNINTGLLSSYDIPSTEQIQTEMDIVNKKINKAKQSISQLQTEGGLKGMGLQSPARLANSRNSSTNTLKQYAINLMNGGGGGMTAQPAEENKDSLHSQGNTAMSQKDSPRKVDKKIFLFNQAKVLETEAFDARNKSPCFGSVKNSEIIPNNLAQRNNSVEALKSTSSMGGVPPLSKNQLADLINRQDSELQLHQFDQKDEETAVVKDQSPLGAATTFDQASQHNFNHNEPSIQRINSIKSITQSKKSSFAGTKQPSIGLHRGSPVPVGRRSNEDVMAVLRNAHGGSTTTTEFQVSQRYQTNNPGAEDAEINSQDVTAAPTLSRDQNGVTSVVQFVKENSQIWE